jgi:hypothetical protein
MVVLPVDATLGVQGPTFAGAKGPTLKGANGPVTGRWLSLEATPLLAGEFHLLRPRSCCTGRTYWSVRTPVKESANAVLSRVDPDRVPPRGPG